MTKDYEQILNRLSRSKFRNRIHLNNKMILYVQQKGIDTIREHAYQLISTRLGPDYPKNDGKQTPMRQVHPVFIAQHACACCCRGCLEKWHQIPKGRKLTKLEINYITELLVKWIQKECGED